MFFNKASRRSQISRKPSAYPALPFHLVRLAQFLSTLIVASILIFFTHHLHQQSIFVPSAFLLLLTVSLLSLFYLIVTSVLHLTHSLNPRLSLILNIIFSTLWLLGLALLSWNLGWTLGHRCTPATWQNSAGIMVCRLYKALTAFTVIGTLSTLLALLLDVRTHRQSLKLGSYGQMLDIKGPKDVNGSSPLHMQNLHEEREGEGVGRGQYKVQRPIEAPSLGYAAPSEQTSYSAGGGW